MRWILLICLNFVGANLCFVIMLTGHKSSLAMSRVKYLKHGVSRQYVKELMGGPSVLERKVWEYKFRNDDSLIINWSGDELETAEIVFNKGKSFDTFYDWRTRMNKLSSHRYLIPENGRMYVALPKSGQLFEVNVLGDVKSIRVIGPWRDNGKKRELLVLLKELQIKMSGEDTELSDLSYKLSIN